MVKNCDYTSDSDHCHHRSKPDSDQMSLTDQSDCDRDTDVEEVKTVFVNPTLLCTVSAIACIASGKLIWVCLPKYQNHCRKQIQKPCENKT